MKLAIINCRSIVNKCAELETLLHVHNLDLLIGTESFLDETIISSEIFPSHFTVYRNDRNRHGGGVFILVRNEIPSSLLSVSTSAEQIWVHVHVKHKPSLIVGSCYCPPSSSTTILDELENTLSDIRGSHPTARILLGGDLNASGIDWQHKSLEESYVSVPFREKLLSITEDFHFEQLVTTPTRGVNILDLLFVSHPDLVTSCETSPGISDHSAIVAEVSTQVKLVKKQPREIFLYHKANWDLIRERMLGICERYFQLNSISQRSVEENWEFVYEKCSQLVQELVPKKTIGCKFHLPWMNDALKRLIKKKQRTYNRAKKYQHPEDWDEYKSLQHQTKSIIRQRHQQYLSSIVNPDNGDNKMKRFWRYIKGKRQDNIGISALKSQTGNIVTESSEKAEILNDQFKSVFTVEDTSCIPDKGTSPYPSIPDFDITSNGVRNLLENCNTNKSPGPDNIHAAFLKQVASEIAPVLSHLFKQSLTEGTLPTSWKQAYVTPVYKKGTNWKLSPSISNITNL